MKKMTAHDLKILLDNLKKEREKLEADNLTVAAIAILSVEAAIAKTIVKIFGVNNGPKT